MNVNFEQPDLPVLQKLVEYWKTRKVELVASYCDESGEYPLMRDGMLSKKFEKYLLSSEKNMLFVLVPCSADCPIAGPWQWNGYAFKTWRSQ
jgi:hypothetical protein